jgi:hypothetical protein
MRRCFFSVDECDHHIIGIFNNMVVGDDDVFIIGLAYYDTRSGSFGFLRISLSPVSG